MKTLKTLLLVMPFALILSCEKEGMCKKEKDDDENERSISANELPKSVTESIQSQFSGAQILEADEITHKDGSLTYDVELKHSGKKMEVMYDANGKYLGEENDDEGHD